MDVVLKKILSQFETINAVPRCSGDEARICRWLQQWAADHQFQTKTDDCGNLLVEVPASPAYEAAPTVVVQGHMDMVCEKTSTSSHDFTRDPIVSRQEGEWLTARDTSLGADNGIALAYAMTLAEDTSLAHPPLELLFTVDEESGLTGVKQLGTEMISGRHLINLDSEAEGIFTIGCAGGVDTILDMDLQIEAIAAKWQFHELSVGGLRGGHSGIDIHKHRGNANKLLARTLACIRQTSPIRLVQFAGGSRHNALAREAKAIITGPADDITGVKEDIAMMEKTIRREYADDAPEFFITFHPGKNHAQSGLTLAETDRILWLLLALPHGVSRMSPGDDESVETSSNLAIVSVQGQILKIVSSQRSSLVSRLEEMTTSVHAIADLAGAKFSDENDYPPWPPDPHGNLVKLATSAYRKLFAVRPKTKVSHAGLECAIIGDRYPDMQMISFGPTIENAHSPQERLHIPSVEKVWRLLTALLASMKEI
jgi:dipeptidase D